MLRFLRNSSLHDVWWLLSSLVSGKLLHRLPDWSPCFFRLFWAKFLLRWLSGYFLSVSLMAYQCTSLWKPHSQSCSFCRWKFSLFLRSCFLFSLIFPQPPSEFSGMNLNTRTPCSSNSSDTFQNLRLVSFNKALLLDEQRKTPSSSPSKSYVRMK